MSSNYGENSPPKATSNDYRNSSYWDKQEERKKKEREEAEEALKVMGIGVR